MPHRTICLFALALGVALTIGSPGSAQTSTADSLKKLEADVARLKDRIKELEGKLSKADDKSPSRTREGSSAKPDHEKKAEWYKKWAESKKDGGKGGPPWAGRWMGFGRMDPEKFKEFMKRKGGEGKKSAAGKGRSHWAGKGKGRHMHHHHHHHHASPAHVEASIDHIIRELEHLRRQLKKK